MGVAFMVLDEAELPESGHEKIDPRTGRADDFGQRLLIHRRDFNVPLVLWAETRQFQKNTGKTFLAVVENLIAEVFFEVHVARQNGGQKGFGKLRLVVKGLNHCPLSNSEYRRCLQACRGTRPGGGSADQTAFTKEVTRSKQGQHRFLSAG